MFNVYGIPGFTSECLQRLYVRAAQRWPSGRFLEIGSYCGSSAIYLAQQCLMLGGTPEILCIDPWTETPDGECGFLYRETIEQSGGDLLPVFLANVESAGVTGLITPLRGYSSELAGLPDVSFDMAFIDGGHSYETCLADLRNYWPKIKPGGILGCHDYWTHDGFEPDQPAASMFAGVRHAVGTFVGETGYPFTLDGFTVRWEKP